MLHRNLATSVPFLLAVLAVACGKSSSSSGSGATGACTTLQACCGAITDPGMQTSCKTTLSDDQQLPSPDQTCAGNLLDYQSFCSQDAATTGLEDAEPTEGSVVGDGGEASVGPQLGFTPSNVDLMGIDTSTLPDVEIQTTDCTIDGASPISCALSAKFGKAITQNVNNVEIDVYYVNSFKIDATAVLKATSDSPIAIVSLGTIDIEGQLLVNATADKAVAGGSVSDMSGSSNVGGGQPAQWNNAQAQVTVQGASGGGYCGAGGAGGFSATFTALPGGIVWGTPQIVPLVGDGGGSLQSPGGGGGGAIQLVAKTSITVGASALVNAGGGGGGAGSSGSATAGAGGGSGGSILFEAPTVMVAGVLAANGGGGGSAGNPVTGTGGSDATANATPAPGGALSTGAGGTGSAGATVTGGKGVAAPTGDGDSAGGGGAGRIRINTTSGVATLSGTLSPAVTTTCVSQGTLTP